MQIFPAKMSALREIRANICFQKVSVREISLSKISSVACHLNDIEVLEDGIFLKN